MARKDATVKARELARQKLAAKLAEQRKREEAIEKHLAAFFETDDTLTTAAAERDAAIAKATKDYEKATAKTTATRAAALSAIKEQGESAAGIAELTGLAVRDVRTLIASAGGASTDGGDAAAKPDEKPSAASPTTDPAADPAADSAATPATSGGAPTAATLAS